MLVAVHQPNFLPWPGFFHKWLISDAMILLDTVQYEKNEWQNRNRIKTAQGAQWVTVPVRYRYPQRIRDVEIADQRWPRKACRGVEQAYAKAPFLADVWPHIRALLEQRWTHLAQLNTALIRCVGSMLGCRAPLYLASEMGVDEHDPSERLIALCRQLDGDGYLSGREGRNYLDAGAFARSGIRLYFQQVEAPVYPQLHGAFAPYLSVLDMLLNTGSDARLIEAMGGMTDE